MVRGDDTAKTAKAMKLLELTDFKQMMRSLEPMADQLVGRLETPASSPDVREKVRELQRRLMPRMMDRVEKSKPALAKVYTDVYTEEEIDGILAFYQTPAGRALLKKMPEVMRKSMLVTVSLMNDLQAEIQKITEEVMSPAQ